MIRPAVIVRELQVDGSGGEHDERESGLGGVEAVGAAHDEANLGVRRYLERSAPAPCAARRLRGGHVADRGQVGPLARC
jgi:hypothetical protein